MRIREYVPVDWSRLCEIHDRARLDELRLSAGEAAFLTLEETAANEGLFAAQLWVAEIEGRVEGFVAFSDDDLTWLYVDPAYSRRGIGRALLRHAIAAARGATFRTEVLEGNAPALGLYLAEGFAIAERKTGKLTGNESFAATGLLLQRVGSHLAATMRLTDGDLLIRPWQPDDAPLLYSAASESVATVGPWLPWLTAQYTLVDSEQWTAESAEHWRARTEFRFGVFDSGDPRRCVGGVGLNHLNRMHGFANLGYWVRSSATGQGIAVRAARRAACFGLTTGALGRIEILTAVDNAASQRIADRLGASFEGVLRDRLLIRGQWIPARLYSLVRADLPALAPAFQPVPEVHRRQPGAG